MSSVLFRCPHCAGTFQAPPSSADQQIRCSNCQGLVTIPGDPSIAGDPSVTSDPPPRPNQKTFTASSKAASPNARSTGIDLGAPSPPTSQPMLKRTPEMMATPIGRLSIHEVLKQARALRVSDIHIAPGAPILFRIARKLVPVSVEILTSKQSERLSLELLADHQRQQFQKNLDYDFMSIDEHGRYRVNVGFFDGEVGTVIRILAQKPKTLAELKLPDVVQEFAQATKGLILLTGSASQGKTTTMTAIIDDINTNYAKHVITVEDPIEYVHVNKKGLVRQRQVGVDTQSFHSALRAALRQNPDVISIGEMRDYDTIKIALTAAETGALVLSTLHIMSIDKIIERLLSFVPTEDEGHIRYVLADTLVGVIHQELIPTRDGGKRVACEILTVTQATKHIIRNRGTFFLRNVISTGKKFGMVPMSASIQALLDEGVITQETANDVMANYK